MVSNHLVPHLTDPGRLSLFYAFYRSRIAQLSKQQNIRKDISSDLHDDIGSTLNSVKVFAHMAQSGREEKKYLDLIESSLTEATAGLRDMIWILDDLQDTINDLTERIKKFALPVCLAADIVFECSVEPDSRNQVLNKKEKRNILLISKEIINNAVKHSGCSRLNILFKKEAAKTAIIFSDDGRGFERNNVEAGNGLNNLQRRADQAGYTLQLDTDPGKGTMITLQKK